MHRSIFVVICVFLIESMVSAQQGFTEVQDTSSSQRIRRLGFPAADVAFDHPRDRVYLTDSEAKRLVQVDLQTGRITDEWLFDHWTDSMTITPDGSLLFVSLLSRQHGSPGGGDEGWIVEIDLASGELTRTILIDGNPWDIVATDHGYVIVSPSYGHVRELHAYDVETGALTGTSRASQRSNLSLHPSQNAVYLADQGVTPSDIERHDFDPRTGEFTARRDSPYHGGPFPMYGNVFAHPSGKYVITRGGGVYTSNPDSDRDMQFVRTLDFGWLEDVSFDEENQGLLTVGLDSSIDYYNLETFESVSQTFVLLNLKKVSVEGKQVYTVRVTETSTVIAVEVSPSIFAAGNTAPTAVIQVKPEIPQQGQEIRFDAAASSDKQDPASDLLYRWDLTGDGIPDTEFQEDPVLTESYGYAGRKLVTLEVKDRLGFIGRDTVSLDVHHFESADSPRDPQPFFETQFEAADIVFDSSRELLYLSCRDPAKVVSIDQSTGLPQKEWAFDHPAESLTLSGDGRSLYVALLTMGKHVYYTPEEHHGAIAEIDLESGFVRRIFPINEDPYDITVTDTGYLVVSPGSGSRDQIRSYDLTTEENVSSAIIRARSRLALHPSQTRVYTANTDQSPLDIERFDIDLGTGELLGRGDSPYYNDHPIFGDVYAHPSGKRLITRGGGVFHSHVDFSQDMIHESTISFVSGLAFSPKATMFVHGGSPGQNKVFVRDAESLQELAELPVDHGIDSLHFLDSIHVLAAGRDPNRTRFLKINLLELLGSARGQSLAPDRQREGGPQDEPRPVPPRRPPLGIAPIDREAPASLVEGTD